MSRQLPYLAMDGVLCDRPQEGCFIGGKRNYARDNISNKETSKMKTELSANQLSRYVGIRIRDPAAADRYWARCMGRDIAADSAIDDETAAQIKEFLKEKLSASDHETLCSMLAGDVEAQDTELPEAVAGGPLSKKLPAEDAKADFYKRFPGLAHVQLSNSGIPIPRRPAKPRVAMDAADTASFFAMFPDSRREAGGG